MSTRGYWPDVFTGATWKEFIAAGASVSGFRESRRVTAQKIKPGDYFLCYLTGVFRFVGSLEVASPVFEDSSTARLKAGAPARGNRKPHDYPGSGYHTAARPHGKAEPDLALPRNQGPTHGAGEDHAGGVEASGSA